MCWPACYEDEVIDMIWTYSDLHFPAPEDDDIPEDFFLHRCDQLWAVDDLVGYIKDNLYENTPFELMSDYMDDCRFRAEKYKDTVMGRVYATAAKTVKDIMEYFVCKESI